MDPTDLMRAALPPLDVWLRADEDVLVADRAVRDEGNRGVHRQHANRLADAAACGRLNWADFESVVGSAKLVRLGVPSGAATQISAAVRRFMTTTGAALNSEQRQRGSAPADDDEHPSASATTLSLATTTPDLPALTVFVDLTQCESAATVAAFQNDGASGLAHGLRTRLDFARRPHVAVHFYACASSTPLVSRRSTKQPKSKRGGRRTGAYLRSSDDGSDTEDDTIVRDRLAQRARGYHLAATPSQAVAMLAIDACEVTAMRSCVTDVAIVTPDAGARWTTRLRQVGVGIHGEGCSSQQHCSRVSVLPLSAVVTVPADVRFATEPPAKPTWSRADLRRALRKLLQDTLALPNPRPFVLKDAEQTVTLSAETAQPAGRAGRSEHLALEEPPPHRNAQVYIADADDVAAARAFVHTEQVAGGRLRYEVPPPAATATTALGRARDGSAGFEGDW